MTSDTNNTLSAYSYHSYDKLRYGDTDRQGHVNNAVFSTLLETGRVEFLFSAGEALNSENCAFVIVNLQLDFVAEMTWPGVVQIGTRLVSAGKSSLTLEQGLFQEEVCVARARTVIVQMNENTRKSHPWSEASQIKLQEMISFSNSM